MDKPMLRRRFLVAVGAAAVAAPIGEMFLQDRARPRPFKRPTRPGSSWGAARIPISNISMRAP